MRHPTVEKQILLTPKLAHQYKRELAELSRERPYDAAHVAELVEYIRNDQMIEIPSIIIAHRNGTSYRLNGQHTIDAVIRADKPLPVYLKEYKCDTDLDMSEIYGLCDNHKIRTFNHVVGVELEMLGLDWPTDIGGKIAQAGARILYGWHSGRCALKNQKKALISRFRHEGVFVVGIYRDDRTTFRQHMNRVSVVMAMIATYQKCQRDALVFWRDIRDGANLKRNAPAKKLRDWLRMVVVQGSAATNPHKVTEREMYCRCITAWNAFRKGTTTSLRYFPNKSIPRVL
jgi:hypothetical protein